MTEEGSDGRIWNSPLRKKFAKRARQQIALQSGVVPKELRKSPSEKKSERGQAKFLKRAGITKENDIKVYPSDCRNCSKETNCQYEHNLEKCPERSLVLRCKQCGQKVRFRVITGVAWEVCPVCQTSRTQ